MILHPLLDDESTEEKALRLVKRILRLEEDLKKTEKIIASSPKEGANEEELRIHKRKFDRANHHRYIVAREAIACARMLGRGLIQWAIDIEIERVLMENGHDIKNVDYYTDISVINRRHVLIDIIKLINVRSDKIKGLGFSELYHALKALEYSEVRDIVAPSKQGKWGDAYTLWIMRLDAVCFVAFRVARGRPKNSALEQVADCYGKSRETLSSWEKRVLVEMPEIAVERVRQAKHCGRKYMESTDMPRLHDLYEEEFGDITLSRYGEAFRRVERRGKRRSNLVESAK